MGYASKLNISGFCLQVDYCHSVSDMSSAKYISIEAVLNLCLMMQGAVCYWTLHIVSAQLCSKSSVSCGPLGETR